MHRLFPSSMPRPSTCRRAFRGGPESPPSHYAPLVFAHACKLGLEGHRVEAQELALPLGPLAGLDQVEEP
jgi:hypothetical protein